MFEEEIQDLGARFVSGKFEARPRINPRSKECDTCQVADFCGYRDEDSSRRRANDD